MGEGRPGAPRPAPDPARGNLRLVPGTQDDFEFLFVVLRTTMRKYVVKTWGAWEDDWQRARALQTFHPETHSIVELDGERIGSLSLEPMPGFLFLERIYILPEWQGRGIGTRILRRLQRQAAAEALPLQLHCLKVNPARSLYERLGWRVVGENEVSWVLEWTPE